MSIPFPRPLEAVLLGIEVEPKERAIHREVGPPAQLPKSFDDLGTDEDNQAEPKLTED
jgi:hypothetical protein